MKTFLVIIIGSILCMSCDFFSPYNKVKLVYFQLGNRGGSTYQNVIVFAKDSTRRVLDSVKQVYTPGYDHNMVTVPNSRDVSHGMRLSALKDIKRGVFEVQAKILNGKLLSQEFGLIDGLNTRQEFKIDLKDSTIIIK